MKCPVCKNHEHDEMDLQSPGFSEEIQECRICGSMWSVNHGVTEVIRDTQENSFLAGMSESVEGDDYNLDGK